MGTRAGLGMAVKGSHTMRLTGNKSRLPSRTDWATTYSEEVTQKYTYQGLCSVSGCTRPQRRSYNHYDWPSQGVGGVQWISPVTWCFGSKLPWRRVKGHTACRRRYSSVRAVRHWSIAPRLSGRRGTTLLPIAMTSERKTKGKYGEIQDFISNDTDKQIYSCNVNFLICVKYFRSKYSVKLMDKTVVWAWILSG
jgi:hypothetical protein